MRETMAVIVGRHRGRTTGTSFATRLLAADQPTIRCDRWCDRRSVNAVAHGGAGRCRRLAIGLGALGVGMALRPDADTDLTAEQVFAAPDVRTVSGARSPAAARRRVVFSREKDAGVLVMNNVAPPQPGTVYQMWLVDAEGPHSAGTMDAKAVAPSTTAVLPDLGTRRRSRSPSNPRGVRRSRPARRSRSCRWSDGRERLGRLQRRCRGLGEDVGEVATARPRPSLSHRTVAVLGDAREPRCVTRS